MEKTAHTSASRWTQIVSQWGEQLLDNIHHYSINNTYHAPPPVFERTQQSLQALSQKLAQFTPKRELEQADDDYTVLDTSQFKQDQVVNVKGKVRLMPANANLWEKNISFVITTSDTALDCNGAVLSTLNDKITAFTIRTPAGQADGIHNVTIKNCLTLGYNHGLLIQQQTPANQRYELLQQGKTTLEAQRAQSPHTINIENLVVAYSRNSGVFVGDHVHHVNFYSLAVVHSGTVGLYFEFGSTYNTVKYGYFSQNGFRIGKPNREAIAIDSSAYNRIEHSQFDHNGAGGIFLYRNCFEHADDPTQANHFLRTQGSDGNVMVNNVFENEPVGVWIAARQSRNLKGFACGAYTILETPFSSYHLDESERNQVLNNEFNDGKTGIIIEDDNNLVQGNQFTAHLEQPIVVGSKIRLQSSEGVVKNNHIIDNHKTDELSQRHMIKFIGGSEKVTEVNE